MLIIEYNTEAKDDIDAALHHHIFNKRQKLNLEHEVDIYLKGETIEYADGTDTLSW